MGEIDNDIKAMRVERGLTQEELADNIGITRQTIIAIEKGGYVPSLELAFRIAREFGKSVEDVFKYRK